jgi:glutamyl-tRNA(Gln) amidotransferase subunit D
MDKFKAGDFVKVSSSKGVFEGVLLPRPVILDNDIVVIKLSSGYNIGLSKKNIDKIELISKFKESLKKKSVNKIKLNSSLPVISVLSTGGTISSRVDYKTGAVYADYSADDFISMCPEVLGFANIKAKKISSIMSEDIVPDDWLFMAKEIKKELQSCDAIVLTHGTDTMHFSSAALSFLLENLDKPVIITGSQRSIDRGSSDAFMNLLCSVIAASKIKKGGVFICMHGSINDDFCFLLNGVSVRKMHSSRRDAFRPLNSEFFAKVFPDGEIEYNKKYDLCYADIVSVKNDSYKNVLSVSKLVQDVSLVYVYPGMSPKFSSLKKKGVVIAATALGHVPTGKNSLVPEIKKLVKNNVPVVIASQTLYGSVHPFVYTNLRKLSLDSGAIFVGNMLPEIAYVKLMYVLSMTKKFDEVKRLMQLNLRGEISDRELVGEFLF